MKSIRTIIVPYDYSEYSEGALARADGLAQQLDSDLHLLHVIRPPTYVYAGELGMGLVAMEASDSRALKVDAPICRLEVVASQCGVRADQVWTHAVEGTGIADSIDAEAERLRADLIVMGTHGRSGLAHLLMGSVAEEMIRRASCPVLVVPAESGARAQTVHWETNRYPASNSL